MTENVNRGRHRSNREVDGARRLSRGGRWAVGALVAAAAGGAALTGSALAAPNPAPAATEQSAPALAAHQEAQAAGTPCSVSTRACVDLDTQRAWLLQNGKIVRGPMTIASGGAGQKTPVGHSFRVYRKDKDHVSGESRTPSGAPAPMPYSVFFADGGIAFHGGDPARSSAGCIRMEMPDAQATFADLQNNDKVQVVNAAQEQAARR